MSSQHGAATGSEDRPDRDDGTDESTGDASGSSTVCFMCQRPVRSVDRRWQGEPVHYQCGAEYRYHVSPERAGGTDRTDERRDPAGADGD